MSNKIIDRVFLYLEKNGIPPTRMEKSAGLSNGYLGTQRKRNADLGESAIIKIIDNCPDLNPIWLLTGQDSMIKSEQTVGDNNSGVVINGNNTGSPIDNRHFYSDSPDVLRAQIELLDERIKEKDAQIKEKDAQIKQLLDILAKK